MWTEFEVRMDFLHRVVASMPANPDLIKKWAESRRPAVRPPGGKSIDEIAEEVYATLPDTEEVKESLHVFQRRDAVLCVRMGTIRAHIKDQVDRLSSLYIGKIEGERSFAVRAKNALYYPPEVYWLPILDQIDQPVVAPTGIYEKPIHAMTPRGRISALKAMEYVEQARLRFPLLVLTQPTRTKKGKEGETDVEMPGKLVVSEKDLDTIFMYGSTRGYGGERGDGEGKYTFTITQRKET